MTRVYFFTRTLILSSALIFSCAHSEKPESLVEIVEPAFDISTGKQEIEEANRNFMALVAAGDSVGIANAYTIDGKVMFSGAPSIEGRANIQTKFSKIIDSGVTRINLDTKNVFGCGELVAEEGEVTVYAGNNVVAEEKYIILWKKEAGEWKLFRDIANSNAP